MASIRVGIVLANIVILGAAGFLGRNLSKQLCNLGASVVKVARKAGDEEHCKRCSNFILDARKPGGLQSVLNKNSTLVSCLPSTAPIHQQEASYFDSPDYIQELLNLAADCGVKRFAYCSSGGTVYGDVKGRPAAETDSLHPVSLYGREKVRGETAVRTISQSRGIRPTIWRFSNLYGRRSKLAKRQGLIEHAVHALRTSSAIGIFGNGSMVRDYVYIEDAARAAAFTLRAPPSHFEYNIGSGIGSSVNEVLELIEEKTGRSLLRRELAVPDGFVGRNVLDCRRIKSEFHQLGFRPLVQGIPQLLDESYGVEFAI